MGSAGGGADLHHWRRGKEILKTRVRLDEADASNRSFDLKIKQTAENICNLCLVSKAFVAFAYISWDLWVCASMLYALSSSVQMGFYYLWSSVV